MGAMPGDQEPLEVVRAPTCPADLTDADVRQCAEAAPTEWFRRAPGRATGLFRLASGRAVVVKRTTAPPRRDGWREVLTGARPRCPAQREFDHLTAWTALGLPVPAPYLWAETRVAKRRVALVVLELVPHHETLRQRLARAPDDAPRFLPPLAALVSRLHRAGWVHRDLYLEHVVLRADCAGAARVEGGPEAMALLDLGRARPVTSRARRWFVKDLAALWHSAPGGAAQAATLLALYLEASGTPPKERAAFARDVTARARRMARHAPRHVDPHSREGRVGV